MVYPRRKDDFQLCRWGSLRYHHWSCSGDLMLPFLASLRRVPLSQTLGRSEATATCTQPYYLKRFRDETELVRKFYKFYRQHFAWSLSWLSVRRVGGKQIYHTVDGRNPAPVDGQFIPLLSGFYTSQVVQDSFHQQYHTSRYTGPKV